MTVYSAVLLYLELVNAAAFALFGVDKLRAKRGRWRIPEAVLLGLAGDGGLYLPERNLSMETVYEKYRSLLSDDIFAEQAEAFPLTESCIHIRMCRCLVL